MAFTNIQAEINSFQTSVQSGLDDLTTHNVLRRIWQHDHTVWHSDPVEITNRLDWLSIASDMQEEIGAVNQFVSTCRQAGFKTALLLGMGGSSLAPEVFRKTFGVAEGFLDLSVVDSTDPAYILGYTRSLDLSQTLFIVSTKSGGTVETFSFFKYFYNLVAERIQGVEPGAHFIAITDPGSGLVDTANHHGFRHIFLNNPNIGGRYSALSLFGLVPAALIGVDVSLLLGRAIRAMEANGPDINPGESPAAWLGCLLGEAAKAGRDKVTFVPSPALQSFGDWVEQLIAESTGKEGKGILPVIGEPLATPSAYGSDRVFVSLQLAGESPAHDRSLDLLQKSGHPVIRVTLDDVYDIGAQFFVWELATAIAGQRLGIQPFDQPNVESAKVLAREMVAAYKERGSLPVQDAVLIEDNIIVHAMLSANTVGQALGAFLSQAHPGDYVAVQAYLTPTPEIDQVLRQLQVALRDKTRLATTIGYGPHFLHSTGQLHKGDGGNGLFIQLTADDPQDLPIPDEAGLPHSSMTFGVLKASQALGDGKALTDQNRRLIRFHFNGQTLASIKRLIELI